MTYSLTLDQTNPKWGEELSFTAVFQKADNKSWPPRIYNPVVAVLADNGSRDATFGVIGKTTNLGGGWLQARLGYVILQGSGTVTVRAWLEFTDGKTDATTILASTEFTITA